MDDKTILQNVADKVSQIINEDANALEEEQFKVLMIFVLEDVKGLVATFLGQLEQNNEQNEEGTV